MITGLGSLRKDGYLWVRLWDGGPGFKIVDDRHPPLFSERNGFTRTLRIGRWRITYLRGEKA